jgi:ppGpp synthetase/RelA/SpoT-type nucleotidyltranferase
MVFSGNQLKNLGKRLRDGSATKDDHHELAVFRQYRDKSLLTCGLLITTALESANIRFVVGGRSKRTKSIIRKLSRDRNKSMDLSRMADLVGLRVIVADIEGQNRALTKIRSTFDVKREFDDRETSQPYHRVHVIVETETGPVEIQVRTLLQHLWANESETFGERVKEGIMDTRTEVYLKELAKLVRGIDSGQRSIKDAELTTDIGKARAPLSYGFQKLSENFNKYASDGQHENSNRTFLFVHDTETNEITRADEYPNSQREEALREYEALSASLDSIRYDVLILNGANQNGIQITHPRLFSVI